MFEAICFDKCWTWYVKSYFIWTDGKISIIWVDFIFLAGKYNLSDLCLKQHKSSTKLWWQLQDCGHGLSFGLARVIKVIYISRIKE